MPWLRAKRVVGAESKTTVDSYATRDECARNGATRSRPLGWTHRDICPRRRFVRFLECSFARCSSFPLDLLRLGPGGHDTYRLSAIRYSRNPGSCPPTRRSALFVSGKLPGRPWREFSAERARNRCDLQAVANAIASHKCNPGQEKRARKTRTLMNRGISGSGWNVSFSACSENLRFYFT